MNICIKFYHPYSNSIFIYKLDNPNHLSSRLNSLHSHVPSSPAHWWRRKTPWNLVGNKAIMVYCYLWEEPNWSRETLLSDHKWHSFIWKKAKAKGSQPNPSINQNQFPTQSLSAKTKPHSLFLL